MIWIDDNKQAQKVLETIALCGEYPTQSIPLIPHKNIKYLRRILASMREANLISQTGSGELKSLRLLQAGIDALSLIHPQAKEQYMLMTGQSGDGTKASTDSRHKSRNLRIAAVMQIMILAGVHAAIWEKPKLIEFYRDSGISATPRKLNPQTNTSNKPYFYTSKEFKRADVEGIYKTSFTRIIGMYVCEKKTYGVFNLGKRLCEWDTSAEMKSQFMMWNVLRSTGLQRELPTNMRITDRIVMAKKLETGIRLAELSYEIKTDKNKKYYRDKKGNVLSYLNTNNDYKATHFILENETGIKMLKLLSISDFRKKLIKRTLEDNDIADSSTAHFGYDGYNRATGEYTLTFFDSDLKSLVDFKSSLVSYKIPYEKATVICFDWQFELVSRFIGESAKVYTVNIDEALNMINI
jgi:hypothetical protein